MEAFLAAIGLDNTDVKEKFAKEQVTLDLLKTMNYDHLDKIGIAAFGHQHKLLTEVKKLKEGKPFLSTLGFIKNETLVFLNFSAQGASILKIGVPIIKRIPKHPQLAKFG